ncbi:hypothetical protein BDV93DRAFT_421829, partial [Ceratobasidium sp. AG-I]
PNWTGFKGLRYFFVFGDSYTTVGFNSQSPVPTDANPLGVSYPGSTTAGGPNWVGYLTTQYNQSKFWSYDYAISGNTVSGVSTQINSDFLPHAGTKPSYAPWTGSNSLFSTFIGINDIKQVIYMLVISEMTSIPSSLTALFSLQETLYKSGARNFLFVNVPPFNRAPFSNNNAATGAQITSWNVQLQSSIATFQTKHSDISAFYYDSWCVSLYTKLLNNPSAYGFTDTTVVGGSFWNDVIHPKSKVHQYMAQDLATFLQSQ